MSNPVQLHQVCTLITDGTHYTPKDVGDGVPFLTVKDMTPNGLDFVNCSKISTENFSIARDGNSAPQFGDVLFSKDGTVGKVQLVDKNIDFAVLSSIAILRPNKNHLDSNYLAHVLKSEKTINDAIKKKTGSAVRRIILSDLKTIQIPLPSLAEQKRIAALLDTADHILKLREATIAKLDQLAQSVFVEMFEATNKNDTKWPVVQLGSAVQILSGYAFDSQNFKAEDGIKLIRIRDVIRGYSETYYSGDFDERYVVNEGDMLIGMDGEFNIAKWGKESALLNQRVCKITVTDERLSENYLFHFLPKQLKLIEDATPFVTVKHLSSKKINDIKIPLPPLHLQNKFLNKSYKIDDLRTKFLLTNDCVTRLIASLQHQSFAVN